MNPASETDAVPSGDGTHTGLEGSMFAVDHAATALIIKRRFPSVSMTPLLVSVQAMELAWVALN